VIFYIKSVGLFSLLVVSSLCGATANASEGKCEAFSELSIVLEQNATDGDSGVVVKDQDIGFDKFNGIIQK